MFYSMFKAFFGCAHSRTTFPVTVSRRVPTSHESLRRTYVACLDCGTELTYNWEKMQQEGRSVETQEAAQKVVSIADGHSLVARLLHVAHRNVAPSSR